MKISLPDVNVLFALMTARHQHQPAALGWMSQREPDSVAICRVTQMGLLRLLTNPKALPEGAFTMIRAWQLINEAFSDRRIFFAPEPPRVEVIWESLSTIHGVGPSAWTDAYLAAFAQGHGYEMVTFDRGFRKWEGLQLQVLA